MQLFNNTWSMALFQRRPILGDQAPLYTTGMQQTLLIVGLGNLGKEYLGTRHNIGFEVLDFFARKHVFPEWISKKDLKSLFTQQVVGSNRIILCKPTTFMNLSGEAVQAVQHYFKVANSSTLVVCDELDIDFGQIRTRVGGSAAGHNGIKSVIQHCGEDFGRVRIGIGPKKPAQMNSADFVLAHFSEAEQESMPLLMQEANSLLSEYAHSEGSIPSDTRSFIL
jgi:peptidyl-tRNA hydrolase, PTH1 family